MVMDTLAVEIFGILLYFLVFYIAWKIKKVDFLVYITVFAILFENLNVLLFANVSSGYIYTNEFLIYIFRTPLFIFLDWAILIFGAYLLSLKLRMSKISRVFFIPLFVTVVDLVIEGISVNLGYWTWSNALGGGNLFSFIPPSNFAGWLGVVFGFILCYEYLERKWLSMFLGYGVFLGVAVIFVFISRILGLQDDNYVTLGIIFLIFLICFVYSYHNNKVLKKNKKDFKVNYFYADWVVYMRGFFYIYALYYFFAYGHYLDLVYDLVLFGVLAIEVYFFLRFRGILKKKI